MSELPWIRFFPSDWLAGTRGMSAAETGIYITLIATMYERGEPVPEDHKRLARLCGASAATFKSALETLISEGKITRAESGLWNDRVGKESDFREEKSEVGRQAANKRWGKNDNKNNVHLDANALPTQSGRNANQKPYTREEKREANASPKKPRRIPDDFVPDLDWADAHGLPRRQAEIESAKFRDYWSGKGGNATKTDWPATWRNWVRTAAERLPQARGPSPPIQAPQLADVFAFVGRNSHERPDQESDGPRKALPDLSRARQG